MAAAYEEHAKVFRAFCDEKRLQILELLRGGEKCACVLLEQLDLKAIRAMAIIGKNISKSFDLFVRI